MLYRKGMMVMKKKIISLIVVVAVGITSLGIFYFINKPDDVKADITKNLDLMFNGVEYEAYPVAGVASSNPYDSVDSEYYDNIISMGTEAVGPLEELMMSGGMPAAYQYVSAVALQEITGCDMAEVTGVSWSNVGQFKEMWNSTMQSLPETLESIKNDSKLSAEEKRNEMEKYGVFGKAYACKTAENEFQLGELKVEAVTDDGLRKEFKELGEGMSEKDLDNVLGYMSKK